MGQSHYTLKPSLSGDRFTGNGVEWTGYAGPSEGLKKWRAAPIARKLAFAHYAKRSSRIKCDQPDRRSVFVLVGSI